MSTLQEPNAAERVDPAKHAGEFVGELRTAIIKGQLSPGQRLVESDLCEQFGVSRGAVREAIVLLEGEGLVTRQRNRGATVRPVTLPEAIEITEVRAVVEALCARKAAAVITASEKRRLIQLGVEMREAAAAGHVHTYNDLSQDSHEAIRTISGQEVASSVLGRLRHQSVRYQYRVILIPGRIEAGLQEHLAVIDAVTSGDPDEAEAQMLQHLGNVADALRNLGAATGLPATAVGPTFAL
jgi:DNA-binding GntR family transcriptional regulator